MIVLAKKLRSFQADRPVAERGPLCATGNDSDMLRPTHFQLQIDQRFTIVDRPTVSLKSTVHVLILAGWVSDPCPPAARPRMMHRLCFAVRAANPGSQ